MESWRVLIILTTSYLNLAISYMLLHFFTVFNLLDTMTGEGLNGSLILK